MGPLLLLAVALALDATAASAALATAGASQRRVVEAAAVFGAFQAGMATLGALGGAALATWVHPYDRWVGAALLVGVGLNMLRATDDGSDAGDVDWRTLLALGLATSIDALASGVTLPMWSVPVGASVVVIGVVTFAMSLGGGLLGASMTRGGPWPERAAGLVLCGLALRLLW